MDKCYKCGAELPKKAKYCEKCGTKIPTFGKITGNRIIDTVIWVVIMLIIADVIVNWIL